MNPTQREFDLAAQEEFKKLFEDLEHLYGDTVAIRSIRSAAMEVVIRMRTKLYME